jgi:hypothetical protein
MKFGLEILLKKLEKGINLMKIIYISDNYTWDNFGTKRSIYEELNSRIGFELFWFDKENISDVYDKIDIIKPNQVWLCHSGLTINKIQKDFLNKKNIKVVGFGLSDPNYFSSERFESYDAYITNHIGVYEEFKNNLPIHYNKTACDFRFHKYDASVKKKRNITLIGVAIHPWFPDKNERMVIVSKLRKKGLKVYAYGEKWPLHLNNRKHVEGDQFLKILQQSYLGLDIQN